MTIPEQAVEVAAEYLPHSMDCEPQPEGECSCWRPRVNTMRAALETARPILLSHEVEQTRLAHLDAMVNAETAGKLQYAIDAIRAYGRDREKYTETGSPDADSAIRGYAYHMERLITEALEGQC